MTYLLLAFEFLKIGLFAMGGGLATLPFLQEMANRRPWFTNEELLNMIAVSESTPGPIGINMATYAGMSAGGIAGGIVASTAVVLPAFIIVLIVAKMLDRYRENSIRESVFSGLRPAVTAMIAAAGIEMLKVSLADIPKYLETGLIADLIKPWELIIFAVLFILIRRFERIHPAVYIALAALAGIILEL